MRFWKVVTAIIIALGITAALIVSAEAEERYIEKVFSFGKYSPTIHIMNAAHPSYAVEVGKDGALSWKKLRSNTDYNDVSQCFTVLPAGSGYYAIYETLPMGGHNARCLTYEPGTGFSMKAPKRDSSGKYASTQRFLFKWYPTAKSSGKAVKNCWRIVCEKDSMGFCTGGWGYFLIRQDNWSENY